MKWLLTTLALSVTFSASAQVWKTLPRGVRILGYRNVITSKVNSSFNQFRSESSLGGEFKLTAETLDKTPVFAGSLGQTLGQDAIRDLDIGTYKVDASAQFTVHGTGFGYGITDRVMFYGEIAYYNARVNARLKRTGGNSYEEVAEKLEEKNGGVLDATVAANLRSMVDLKAQNLQSYITNEYKYKPIGDWYGSGYGDMETGFMIKAIDKGYWGLLYYPGVILPTGRQDDPDIIQDVGFGDGQLDIFNEVATGYIFNDYVNVGTSLRFTYQTATTKELRVPTSRDVPYGEEKTDFDVKYGNRVNWMLNSTLGVNDWLSFTPMYRFMYQMPSIYNSDNSKADEYLAYNSDKMEHQVQMTTSISSIQPFLKKKFVLPAQINLNVVQTVGGRNVPKVGRFEMELRMLF